MFRKEEMGDTIPVRLQISFFIVYTVCRVFLMPYGLYKVYLNMYYTWAYLGLIRKVCMFIGMLLFVILTIMNYYWYYLMVKRIL